MVLPVLHKLHRANKLYSYDDLYRIVSAFRPDQVGVEIRQEDLRRSDTYLRRNYPDEMVHLAKLYGDRAFGFDWLGDELKGKAVPDDWWITKSNIKKLEQELSNAPLDRTARDKALSARLNTLSEEQDDIIKTATAAKLADGRYDRATAAYYKTVRVLTFGTPYSALSKFYAMRDVKLERNIIRHLRQHPVRRVVIVTGADHHGPIVEALTRLGGCAKIAPVEG